MGDVWGGGGDVRGEGDGGVGVVMSGVGWAGGVCGYWVGW